MVDPYNDNDINNYKRWLQINHDAVLEYLTTMGTSIDGIGLLSRSYMMLKLNKKTMIADIFDLSATQLACLEFSDEKLAKDVYTKCFYFMKEIRDDLVAYVEKKGPAQDEDIGDISDEQVRAWLMVPSHKEQYVEYLIYHDIPIERLDLATRTYNVLKRSRINLLSEAVKLYPDGFEQFRNFGTKSADEIRLKIELNAQSFIANRNALVEIPSEDGNPAVEEYNPQTVGEALSIPEYKDKVLEFFRYKEILIESFGFSNRTFNALNKEGIHDFTEILELYPEQLNSIMGLGAKSISELNDAIINTLSKYEKDILSYIEGDYSAVFDDEYINDYIMSKYKQYKPFYGISLAEFKDSLPEIISEKRLRKCIGKLLEQKKIEYVDFRCYRVYPSFYDAADEVADNSNNDSVELLLKFYSGMTYDKIGKEAGVTRQRVEQKIKKAYDDIVSYTKAKYGTSIFDEDYYAYLYETYDIPKETWINDIGVSEKTYQYLKRRYSSVKGNSIDDSLNDDNVSVSLKYKIIDAINKKKIEIDGMMFDPKRGIIEDYIIYKYCQNDTVFDDFCNLYNRILRENGVPDNPDIYYTEEVIRTRENKIADSHKVLWKYGKCFRYYDVDGKDYQELLDTIGIYSYRDTGLSTLYWINNYPDIMEKYDIRDRYELHNLLKKIIPEGSINGIHFDRNPGVIFGDFDRNQAIYELLCRYSPISSDDFADIIHEEYGYDRGTIQADYFKAIRQYYHKGVYSVDFKSIPDENASQFLGALNEDLYFDNELRDIYFGLFPNANPDDINPRSMQEIGFTAFAKYYLKNKWSSLAEYFRYLLTKDELFDYSAYNKRYGYIVLYSQTFREIRASFDLFILDDGTALSIDRLRKVNIQKQDIIDYCDSVDQFVGDSSFFTLRSLTKSGFESSLDILGFEDSFYERILEICGRFNSTHCENVMVLAKGDGTKNFTKKDFILAVVSKFRSIKIDDLEYYLADEFGIKFKEKHKLTSLFADADVYYDQIMDTVYANKEVYYDELG